MTSRCRRRVRGAAAVAALAWVGAGAGFGPVPAAGATQLAQTTPAPAGELLDDVLRLLCDLTGLLDLCPPPPTAPPNVAVTPPTAGPEPPGETATAGTTAATPFPARRSSPTTLPVATTAAPTVPWPPPSTAPAEAARATPAAADRAARTATAPAPVSRLRLPAPGEVEVTPATVSVAAASGLLGMVLLGFPAELFNKTLQANYGALGRLLPWIVARPEGRPLPAQVAALVGSCAVAGLVGSFQKVEQWTATTALTTGAAIGFGFLVTVVVFEVAGGVAGARLGLPRRTFRSYPGALPVVALFVGISALGRLEPAYVYGHLAGSRWRGGDDPAPRERALQVVAASAALLAVAVGAWAARAGLRPGLGSDLLAGVSIVGLNRLAFGLLPATFLDGNAVAAHSRALWAAVYAPILAIFSLLVLVPTARQARGPVLVVSAVLFCLFAGLSLGTWAWFRRSSRAQPSTLGAIR